MEIKIEIDNEKFEKLVSIQNKITDEEMAELFKEGLQQYFKSEAFFDKLSSIIFTKGYYYSDNYDLTNRGQRILNDIFNDSETKAKYVQIITNILEQHSKEILVKGLADIILQGLLNTDTVVGAIRNISQMEIQSYINNQNNNQWIN